MHIGDLDDPWTKEDQKKFDDTQNKYKKLDDVLSKTSLHYVFTYDEIKLLINTIDQYIQFFPNNKEKTELLKIFNNISETKDIAYKNAKETIWE